MDSFGGALGVAAGALTAVTAAAATYYLTTKPDPYELPVDLNNQSVLQPDGSRMSPFCKDGKLMDHLYEDVTTTHNAFKRGIRVSNNGPCLAARTGPNKEYEWLSYQEVYDRARMAGSGLIAEGLAPRNDTFVGIYSQNRIEWVVTEQACSMFSMVCVALYDTLGQDTSAYIINQTGLRLVICDNSKKAQSLLGQASAIPTLECLVVMDAISDENRESASKNNVKIITFQDLLEKGRTNLKDPVPPKPSDLAMLSYTSGTTGEPKGAMLTHECLISNIAAIAYQAFAAIGPLTPADVHLSYLPLAHMFERGMHVMMFMHGCQIGFFQGDVKLLTADLQALRPTLFPTVPRLINRMYDKVQLGVKGSKIKSWLLNMAVASKTKEIRNFIIRRDSIWDKLVFGKIQNLLGGRIRLVILGSAPLEKKTLDFFRCAFGCIVMEGYGQTEATAGITFNVPGEIEAGHVGPPLACNYVKLVDVPDMDYYARDGRGEICAKGPSVMKGYYKNPEKTAEALDSNGWLHTGDIGMWLESGVLKIIDRKKNIFKLSQGEYICPEKIENTYMRSAFVAQAFVDGDSFQSYCMGILVPDEEVLMMWAKENNLQDDFKTLCQTESVKDMILADILKIGREDGLKGFELVKDVILHSDLFSIENGLLTPTFKNKRPQLRKYFRSEFEALYKKHST